MQMPNALKARLQSAAAGGVRAHRIIMLIVMTGYLKFMTRIVAHSLDCGGY